MQFAHSGSQTEKQPSRPPLSYDATTGAPHSAEPAPSYDAAAILPSPGTVQEPHHSGKPIHPQHRAMAATRAASRRCTIAPKPRHLTASRQVRLAPPRHCSRAAGNLKTKNWPVRQLFCDYGLPQNPQSRIKTQKYGRNGSFTLYGDRKESAIAKKLQKSRDFCFRNDLLPRIEGASP